MTKAGNLPNYSLLVTFDDGHKSNISLLPIFIKYNVKPMIYLCSKVVGTFHPFWWKMLEDESPEGYKKMTNTERLKILKNSGKYDPEQVVSEPQGLTREDIMMLKGRVTFGSHTQTHPILIKCTDEEQENEIVKSRVELENLCGEPVRHFAYPNGDYNQYSITLCKKAGYLTARTTDVGWNGKNTDFFQLKLVGISDDADIHKLRLQLSGIFGWMLNLLRMIQIEEIL
jgi:peptidoglycan/xylan/chitin deacetylase (PgdA/CDA1 family)